MPRKRKGPRVPLFRDWRENARYELDTKTRASEKRRLRRERELQSRIASNLRTRTRDALRSYRWIKDAPTAELVGCSWPELRIWIEAQFQPGMSWGNYGSAWHIDHIKPLAAFDLRDPAQQRVAFSFVNLQPLWAEENLRKGAQWP